MATLTIHDIDPNIEAGLRQRATRNGTSVENEVRNILAKVIVVPAPDDGVDLAEAIRRRFAPFGGVDDLVEHPRQDAPDPPKLFR